MYPGDYDTEGLRAINPVERSPSRSREFERHFVRASSTPPSMIGLHLPTVALMRRDVLDEIALSFQAHEGGLCPGVIENPRLVQVRSFEW
jgi:hypothetical protein